VEPGEHAHDVDIDGALRRPIEVGPKPIGSGGACLIHPLRAILFAVTEFLTTGSQIRLLLVIEGI
jgi:hypothetical protein